MRRWVWKIEEIQQLPEFGNDHGWFYGLIRHDGLHIGEIIPGYGYTKGVREGWQFPNPVTILRDIWHYQPGRP